jgi:hypothetical protein
MRLSAGYNQVLVERSIRMSECPKIITLSSGVLIDVPRAHHITFVAYNNGNNGPVKVRSNAIHTLFSKPLLGDSMLPTGYIQVLVERSIKMSECLT